MKTCFLWFHKWGKWDEPKFYSFIYERGLFSNDFFAGYLTYRTCERCGRHQERKTDEREIQAKKDYEFTTFMLKKSKYFANLGNLDKANYYLKLAEFPYNL